MYEDGNVIAWVRLRGFTPDEEFPLVLENTSVLLLYPKVDGCFLLQRHSSFEAEVCRLVQLIC